MLPTPVNVALESAAKAVTAEIVTKVGAAFQAVMAVELMLVTIGNCIQV